MLQQKQPPPPAPGATGATAGTCAHAGAVFHDRAAKFRLAGFKMVTAVPSRLRRPPPRRALPDPCCTALRCEDTILGPWRIALVLQLLKPLDKTYIAWEARASLQAQVPTLWSDRVLRAKRMQVGWDADVDHSRTKYCIFKCRSTMQTEGARLQGKLMHC